MPNIYGVQNPSLSIELNEDQDSIGDMGISLTLGAKGLASDMEKLGLVPIFDLRGSIEEDLLFYVSGESGDSAVVSAEFEGAPRNVTKAPEPNLILEFSEDDIYRIIDKATETTLAEREFHANEVINYQGLEITLTGVPSQGDRFEISPRVGGQGDTANLSKMVELEKAELFEGSYSLGDRYLSLLSKAGTISKQAEVAADAYQVLRDQAVTRRETLSGVNLDEEASNLIRFQQSYQASARLVRTASELFDTIVRL